MRQLYKYDFRRFQRGSMQTNARVSPRFCGRQGLGVAQSPKHGAEHARAPTVHHPDPMARLHGKYQDVTPSISSESFFSMEKEISRMCQTTVSPKKYNREKMKGVPSGSPRLLKILAQTALVLPIYLSRAGGVCRQRRLAMSSKGQ